jgi:hypothetical protein
MPVGGSNKAGKLGTPGPGVVWQRRTIDGIDTPSSSSTSTMQQHHQSANGGAGGHMKTYTQKQRTLYRVALNYFNKNPERGMQLLIRFGFVEPDGRHFC